MLSSTLLLCTPVTTVVAADYVSIETAQRSAFQHADRFEEQSLNLSAEQQRAVLLAAGPQPQHGQLKIYRAWQGSQLLGYFFVDEVIGRQNLITYGIAIDHQGQTSVVEILSYRESHGGEVRNTNWRKQFAGRKDLNQIRFTTDIKNIAGATLSCEHVTQGVRWLYALWQVALKDSH
jgi:hypothetical protein